MASSRTELGRDDRGARIGEILDGMSIYQIRSHYIVYSLIRKTFKDSGYVFNNLDRPKMEIFIPWESYINSMQFDEKELNQFDSIVNHAFFGLNADDLITTFQYGPIENIKQYFPEAKDGGVLVSPSAFGAELYLWGYGLGDKKLAFILKDEEFEDVKDIPIITDQVVTVSKET